MPLTDTKVKQPKRWRGCKPRNWGRWLKPSHRAESNDLAKRAKTLGTMLFTCMIERRIVARVVESLVASIALAAAMAARADGSSVATKPSDIASASFSEVLAPSAFFAQFGRAEEATAATAGLIWRPGWSLPAAGTVYLEASISQWRSRGTYPSDRGLLTQLAFVPVFRYQFDSRRSPWFIEGGVGVTVTSNLYRSGSKYFSTSFNFGSHIGAGYLFGAGKRNEVSLRVEHFSNGGIKRPNPGENFVQLRYVHHFE